jgi:hypothetical protein
MSDCAQLFLSLGDEWLVVGSHLATTEEAIGAELQTSLQNWQAAKFVINQSAKHSSLEQSILKLIE